MSRRAQIVADKLEDAFRRRFSRSPYAPGRQDYYDFSVFPESDDGHRFSLRIVFKCGEKYCCAEPACHFGFWTAHAWQLLRKEFDAVGLDGVGPFTISTIRVIVEEGAELGLWRPNDCIELEPCKGYSYEIGPFREDSPEGM